MSKRSTQQSAAVQLTLRRTIVVATTSAAPAVRASGRPAGHPVLAFVAADQASDLVGRPGSAGRLGLDCSCAYLDWVEVELEVTGADQTGSIGYMKNVVMQGRSLEETDRSCSSDVGPQRPSVYSVFHSKECRRKAEEADELAQKATDPAVRTAYEEIARLWRDTGAR